MVIIIMSGFLLFGCRQGDLTPLEYALWVENPENGLQLEEEQEAFKFSLQYKPVDYTIVNELQKEVIEKEILEKERKLRDGLQYFTFKMSTSHNKAVFSGNSTIDDSVKNYLNYKIQKDFFLIEHGDTLPCKLFHYENTNGMSPYDAFVLGFETNKNDSVINDKTFLFKAHVVDLNKIEMKIGKTALSKIPNLETL